MLTLDMEFMFAEILPRLPVKSIIRSKCVSKSFQSVLSSRTFVGHYLHYRYSLSSNANEILILSGECDTICFDINSNTRSPATATFDWSDQGSARVVGSSNGLLCISTHSSISVLNPSTRICKHIPIIASAGPRGFNVGLAFDYENLDFKIVVVSEHHEKSATKTRTTGVYSLNTDSWKIIENVSPIDSIKERQGGGTLIDYHLLHWMFWSPSLRKRKVCCFDVCKDNWVDDVLLPRYYYDPDYTNYLLEIGVFDDCLFASFENRDESCFDVWLMREYGVQDSWVKLLSIDLNDIREGVVPIASRRGTGDILIRKRCSSTLFWYNSDGGGMSEAKFDRAPDFSRHKVYMCSRSNAEIPDGKLFLDPYP